jgi:hypothetical protein
VTGPGAEDSAEESGSVPTPDGPAPDGPAADGPAAEAGEAEAAAAGEPEPQAARAEPAVDAASAD